MDVFASLLGLYSKTEHTAKSIESDGHLLLTHFGVTNYEALCAIPGYELAFSTVSSAAWCVDRLVDAHPLVDAQPREAVRLLRRMLDDGELQEKREVVKTLIERRLSPRWSTEQQMTYKKKKEILEWRDYFVSYTNRDSVSTNSRFRTLIRTSLGKVPNETQNYLARLITRHLRRNEGLSGFFDEDSLKIGEDIREEVDTYCRRSFALVQVVEPLTFEKQPPVNWCFYEYTKFNDNADVPVVMRGKSRHFFVLTDELSAIKPANLAPLFGPWWEQMATLRYAAVTGARDAAVRAMVKEIAGQILLLRTNIVNAWLDQ